MVKNILITGSGGFVGKNLKRYLQNEYNILSPRSFELDCVNEDDVRKYFSDNKIDFIIHCASTGGVRNQEDKETTIEDNLKMVDNLLSFKNQDTRMILFGSGAMYGKLRNLHKVKENEIGEFIPPDLYGKSKLLISEKIKDNQDVVCLNIFACYGYDERETRFPTYAIKQNLNHLPIEINRDVVFDYLFIEDLYKIIKYFIKNQPKENIINVTPINSIKLSEIAQIVNKISDYKSEIVFKTDILGMEYTGDNTRLLNNIPDFEFTSIENGIKELYDYIKNKI